MLPDSVRFVALAAVRSAVSTAFAAPSIRLRAKLRAWARAMPGAMVQRLGAMVAKPRVDTHLVLALGGADQLLHSGEKVLRGRLGGGFRMSVNELGIRDSAFWPSGVGFGCQLRQFGSSPGFVGGNTSINPMMYTSGCCSSVKRAQFRELLPLFWERSCL